VRVVFDTNVVASATFWRGAPFDCLVRWADGRCEAVVSPELMAEYHDTIEELRREYPSHACVEWAMALSEAATLVFPSERAEGATPDPGDEMVLECSVAADAHLIVTGDKRHLLPLGRFREVEIVSPTEFLRRIPRS
jgi:putative PIN family toxin of toxin-antitoxin system